MNGPDPFDPHPLPGFPQVCFIKNTVTNPNIVIGDYTYYDDPDGAENFERNVLYHFPFIGDKLVIGKFCALARGVKFIMNGANHKTSGISTYPFYIFGKGWESAMPAPGDLPYKGDTVIGNDVWIGYEALIMPGVKIRRRDYFFAFGGGERCACVYHRRWQSGPAVTPALRAGRGCCAAGDRLVELADTKDHAASG